MKKYPRKTAQEWFFSEYEDGVVPYHEKPGDDNERFHNLFNDWIKTHSESSWAQMWELARVLCLKAVRLKVKKENLHFTFSELEDFALDGAAELMDRIKKYWGYSYEFIVSQAMRVVLHPLYARAKTERLEKQIIELLNSKRASSYDEALELLGTAAKPSTLQIEKEAGQLFFNFMEST